MAEEGVILPICCFGNVFFYKKYFANEYVCFDQWESYPKQTYRNRYEILNHNGRQSLTVPVVGQKGMKIPLNQIEIDYRQNWELVHWRSIVSAYQRSPFFEFYKEELETLLFSRMVKLIDFNMTAHNLILEWLGEASIETMSAEYIEFAEGKSDLRDQFKPSKSERKVPKYLQVFADRHGFTHNLSVLDLIFNLGPHSHDYLIE